MDSTTNSTRFGDPHIAGAADSPGSSGGDQFHDETVEQCTTLVRIKRPEVTIVAGNRDYQLGRKTDEDDTVRIASEAEARNGFPGNYRKTPLENQPLLTADTYPKAWIQQKLR